MPVDWLLVWGVTKASGLLVNAVLGDLAQDVAKDKAKDYIKGCFGSVFKADHKDTLQRTMGIALRELVQPIEDELLDTGLTDEQVQAWTRDIKQFIRSKPL